MQNINLLLSLPERAKIIFPARLFYRVFAVLSGLYLVITVMTFFSYRHEQSQLKPLEAQRFQAAAAYEEIIQKYPLLVDGGPLKDRVSVLAQKLLSKNQSWGNLTHTRLTRGFSAYLTTLAQYTPPGLWFTRIHIQPEIDNVSLYGQTFHADLISMLMQKLSETPLFDEKPFQLFRIRKISKGGLIQFEVSTNQFEPANEEENDTDTDTGNSKPEINKLQGQSSKLKLDALR